MQLSPEEQAKQERYRDARSKGYYDSIWQSVGKCVFCDLREKYVIFEENGIVMTISLFAYIDGHFMIMPRRHVRTMKDLTQLEWETVRKFSYIAKKLIKEVHGVSGMQFVQKDGLNAQSTVNEHLHFHCIPFDSPDLCVWNYRDLKHTPLENVALYRQARKKIITADMKFEKKYRHESSVPVVCDLLVVNKNQAVLFQQRKEGVKFTPDTLTLPGGRVDDFEKTLEDELLREVREETGLMLKQSDVRLVASRLTTVKLAKQTQHLRVKYALESRFLWNTYITRSISSDVKLTPGDDCEALLWVPATEVPERNDISEGLRQVIQEQLL